MDTAKFFEKFELFAHPEEAAKHFREIVLNLAFSGKLKGTDPSGWETYPIGDFFTEGLKSINAPDTPNQTYELWSVPSFETGAPEIVTGAQVGSTKRELRDGTILLGKINPHLNRIWVVSRRTNHPMIASQEWINITAGDTWDTGYLARLLSSPSFNRSICATAQGMGSLTRANTKQVAQILVHRPPLREQKKLIAKVDELMALCDRLEAQLKDRDVKQAALAKAALATFTEDPTPENLQLLFHPSFSIEPEDIKTCILSLALKGHLCRQLATEGTATKDLSEAGVDINKWKVDETERRYDIPASWTWIKFGGAGDQRLGKMLDEAKNTGELKPYLRNTSVQWMRFNLEDVKLMRIEKEDQEELRLRKGDLLICEGGQPGRCAIWEDNTDEMYFQKALHRVRPCCAIDSRYLAMNLRYDCTSKVIDSLFTGATIKHLTGRSLSAYSIPVPPYKEQLRIIDQFEVLMNLVNSLEAQLEASRTTGEKLLEAMVAKLTAA
jgi:type I restriction enzyme S subunit